MSNEERGPTCGKGLAEHAAFPSKLAAVVASIADVLEMHTGALVVSDPNAKRELDAYLVLVNDHRRIAGELGALAARMAGHRDLPMGAHDETVLAAPGPREAFEHLVKLERDLAAFLAHRLKADEDMLRQMSALAPGP